MAQLFKWNAGLYPMCYAWTGKLWLNPHPKAWAWVRVRAEAYDDITIAFFTEGGTLLTKVVTSSAAFRLPVRADYSEIYYTLTGTSRVRSVEIADDVMELD